MSKYLLLIFALALLIRFLYFPGNTYFSYDAARDSYTSLEILKGHLKIVGPPSSSSNKLFHGPLIYYLYAPIYLLTNRNVEAVSAILRIINALGVFLVFLIGKNLFSKKAGFLASFLFAISFEQTQYALFFGHPSLAAVTVLIFYLGLSLLIFKKKSWGLIICLLGLGLSIQSHFIYSLLLPVLGVYLILFRQSLRVVKLRELILGVAAFLLTVSTFIVAQAKFHLMSFGQGSFSFYPGQIWVILQRFILDNFYNVWQFVNLAVILILVFAFIGFARFKSQRKELIFLLLWLCSGFLPYIFSNTAIYYLNASSSVSLLVLAAFLISKLPKKISVVGILLISMILISNFEIIAAQNPFGPNRYIVIQRGMVLSNEKAALDYIYAKANKTPFSVNALAVPLKVNTTWSYLFEWYGKGKFGFLPVWGGETALGYSGELEIITDRSKLPNLQFSIIEPTVGITSYDKEDYFKNENYFTKVTDKKKFGSILVQVRKKI